MKFERVHRNTAKLIGRVVLAARTRILERLAIQGPTRRSITVVDLANRVVAPALGRPDQGLALQIARLLNADPEAGVWVVDVDEESVAD